MAIEIGNNHLVDARRFSSTGNPGRNWLQMSGSGITAADRILFTERLSLQMATGVTLYAALQSLQQNAEKPAMKQLIARLMEFIVEGGKFSDALANHPEIFSSTYVNLVAVSESGGFLPRVLDQLVEMDEKAERLRSAIISALSYPAFLLLFSVGVTVFILVSIFPQFSTMFEPIYASLPATTRFLMGASDLLRNNPLHLLLPLAGVILLLVAVLRQPAGKRWLDRMKLHAPLFKAIYIRLYLIRLMRTMGISLERGVSILAALQSCREVVPNLEFRSFMNKLEAQVREGQSIASGFREAEFIPPGVLQMIATGEESGKLGHVMARIADFYDRELTKKLDQVAKLAEPIMLMVMGGLVGIIVSSLILPIFKLSRAVG